MAYGRFRKRESPYAAERREREAKDQARFTRDRARLHRLLRVVRKIPLRGAAAQNAWNQKEVRSLTVGRTSDGSHVQVILRTDGESLFLQEPGGMSWNFYRLVPKHHVLRREESEDDERRDPAFRQRLTAWHKRKLAEKREDFGQMTENVRHMLRAVAGGGTGELAKMKTVRTPIGGFQLGGTKPRSIAQLRKGASTRSHARLARDPMKWTVLIDNELLRKATYTGSFLTEEDARDYAASKAQTSRKFATFTVWTGSAKRPGSPTKHTYRGIH